MPTKEGPGDIFIGADNKELIRRRRVGACFYLNGARKRLRLAQKMLGRIRLKEDERQILTQINNLLLSYKKNGYSTSE